jgi:type II secretory pathway pseudopilin PulG
MKNRDRQQGFALAALICIITAALIVTAAVVPAYVMQAKRERERELIFRGEEYVRAIEKYQRKYQAFPGSIDDLLLRDGVRFLRRQYTDPITGEEFRLIRVNPDGTLSNATTIVTIPTPVQGTQNLPAVPGGVPGTGTNPNQRTNAPAGQTTAGVVPAGNSGFMGTVGGAGGSLGANTGVNPFGGGNQPAAGQGQKGAQGQQPSGAFGGVGGIGTGGVGTFGGGSFGTTSGQALGQNAANSRTGVGGNTGNFAITTSFNSGGQQQQMPQINPGIAGVASDSVSTGVMVYNTKEKYNEWEFVAPLVTAQAGNNANNSGNNNNNNNNTRPGTVPANSSFGPVGGGGNPVGGNTFGGNSFGAGNAPVGGFGGGAPPAPAGGAQGGGAAAPPRR